MRVAQVFSDPPLNIVGIEKHDGTVRYERGLQAPANGLCAALPDGAYRVGFRAPQLQLADGRADRHVFPAEVTVTEITGSESFVHIKRADTDWVAVLEGVHEFLPGQKIEVALDPGDVFVFDAGRPVAAPDAA